MEMRERAVLNALVRRVEWIPLNRSLVAEEFPRAESVRIVGFLVADKTIVLLGERVILLPACESDNSQPRVYTYREYPNHSRLDLSKQEQLEQRKK